MLQGNMEELILMNTTQQASIYLHLKKLCQETNSNVLNLFLSKSKLNLIPECNSDESFLVLKECLGIGINKNLFQEKVPIFIKWLIRFY